MNSRVRLWLYLAATCGICLTAALVVKDGYRGILSTLELAGWGLLWLVPIRAAALALDARGWWLMLRPGDPKHRAGWGFLTWVANVRDGVSNLLPVARVGGDLLGIRLVMMRGLGGAAVTASVLVEISITLINQFLFALLGLVLLVDRIRPDPLLLRLTIGVSLALPLALSLLALLRYGSVFQRLRRALKNVLGGDGKLTSLLGDAAVLDDEIRVLCGRMTRLIRCGLWQLAGMLVGAVEIWFTLKLLHHPVGLVTPLILESLTQALRQIGFAVPAGLGVQEAAFVMLGGMLGLSGDLALSLALARRLRELACGIPMILSWQWVEGRRLRTLFSAPFRLPRKRPDSADRIGVDAADST